MKSIGTINPWDYFADQIQDVESGKQLTLPAPVKSGYTFLGWFEGEEKVCDTLSYTFKIDHTATYTAKWSANADTTYKVEYYLENIDKNGYDLVETDILAGKTDTTATKISERVDTMVKQVE
mgnify:CR=1 FL=1